MLKPITRQDIARAKSILHLAPNPRPKPLQLRDIKRFVGEKDSFYCTKAFLKRHQFQDPDRIAVQSDLPTPLTLAQFTLHQKVKHLYLSQEERDRVLAHFGIPEDLSSSATFRSATAKFTISLTLDVNWDNLAVSPWLNEQRAWKKGEGKLPDPYLFHWGRYSDRISFPGLTDVWSFGFQKNASYDNAWELVDNDEGKTARYWYTRGKRKTADHLTFRFTTEGLERVEEIHKKLRGRQRKTSFDAIEFRNFMLEELRQPTGQSLGFTRAPTRKGNDFEFSFPVDTKIRVLLPNGMRLENDDLVYLEFFIGQGRIIHVFCYKDEDKSELIGTGQVAYSDFGDNIFWIKLITPPSLAQPQDQPLQVRAAS